MKKIIFIITLFLTTVSCDQAIKFNNVIVTNEKELNAAINRAQPSDNIIMANGVWKDIQIKFFGEGMKGKPIILRGETAGMVTIEGLSCLKLGGSYLEVKDLYFKNGHTPSNAVIDFKIDDNQVANHCRITNCVIEDFNQLSRDRKDHWIEFWGRNNQLDHCNIKGKTNEGPTVRVEIKGNRNIRNYHQIINNHFGPRPRKGGPKGETIQLGDSFSSMSPGNTIVANNLFEECNGEVEIISSKTNFNEFRNNVFYKCEGSLVTRHGNYCIIDGNYFIGDKTNENIGGIRIINTGHWVTNNYFYNLKGKDFRSPLAVMNGIPKSPLNRYNQVTDVVIAFNTFINSVSPWQFGVGTNIDQKEVLPLSEIRSARPLRMLVANNIIYNEEGDKAPIIEHDKADGIMFKSNIINNQGIKFKKYDGIQEVDFNITKVGDNIFIPTQNLVNIKPFNGFEFETITKDLFGNSRMENNSIGAVSRSINFDPMILEKAKYGTDWFTNEVIENNSKDIIATSKPGDLMAKIEEASSGDNIILSPGIYTIDKPIVIDKTVTIKSQNKNKAEIIFFGSKNTPLFELNPKGNLNLMNVNLKGNQTQYAFASLKENMHNHFGLTVSGSEISNFKYVLKVFKQSFAEEITFDSSILKNNINGIELSEETNDKGDYNTEYLTVVNCQFLNVQSNVIDYYRGGYDESTIGGNLLVSNSTFINCGNKEQNGILLNTRGIVNVNISNNTFKNNPVKLIALLWGAKNNSQENNEINNSGEIKVEQNLKLKLMY